MKCPSSWSLHVLGSFIMFKQTTACSYVGITSIHKVTVDCGHPSGLRVRQKGQCYINANTVKEKNNYNKIGLLDRCLRAPNYSTHLN